MNEAVRHFRRQAGRDLAERRGTERRYSASLRQAAVAYWRTQEHAGDTLSHVARTLGVAPVSLRRWATEDRFHAVQVIPDSVLASGVTVVVDGERLRIEGLDLETAVQLITRLR